MQQINVHEDPHQENLEEWVDQSLDRLAYSISAIAFGFFGFAGLLVVLVSILR